MENDKVVNINFVCGFKYWWSDDWVVNHSTYFNVFVHSEEKLSFHSFCRLVQLTLRRNGHYLLKFQNYSLGTPFLHKWCFYKQVDLYLYGNRYVFMANLQHHIMLIIFSYAIIVWFCQVNEIGCFSALVKCSMFWAGLFLAIGVILVFC
jgi:hypothetical protein